MKSKKNSYFKFFSLFFAIAVLVSIAGCTGTPPAVPIINSFLADPLTITEGESSTLSWSVTDATTVTIDQSIGSVALVSTTTVSPTTTTTYTLTATNVTGSVTASVTVTVGAAFGSIDINSTPDGAKVYLDGVDTGSVTPIILTNIDAGNHIVKLDKYHYKVWEDTAVTVNANQTTYLNPPLIYASTQTIILQPGAEGKDTAVQNNTPDVNYGDFEYVCVGNSGSTVVRIFIQFALSAVPADVIITDADLKLYQYSTAGSNNFTVGLYNVTGNWGESTITWNLQPTSSTDAEITNNITAGATTWESWDIDSLVRGWLDGTITNYGMLLKDTDESSVDTFVYFRTSDYATDATERPKLEIDYYIP